MKITLHNIVQVCLLSRQAAHNFGYCWLPERQTGRAV
jgi:hypothetical protein